MSINCPRSGRARCLADIIACDLIPVVRLTEVFRQAAGSRVIVNAHRINRGQMPELTNDGALSDFYFIDAEEPEDGIAKIIAVVRDRIPKAFGLDAIRDVQVLCPMNRGGLGARSLNIELQKALNPPGEARVERFGWTFGPGDKVMQIENDYDREVYNGDLGIVQRVDQDEGELIVAFDGRDVSYGFGELDELVLAYATTIHKSQGSEYPAVVIPLVTQHYMMLARNLLYTGVTRGKRLVVLVGQRKALAIAVRNQGTRRRWAKLREHLAGHPEWLSDEFRGSASRSSSAGLVPPMLRLGCAAMTHVSPDRTSDESSKVAVVLLVRLHPSSTALNCASRRIVASGAIGIGARRFFLIFTDWGFTRDSLHV